MSEEIELKFEIEDYNSLIVKLLEISSFKDSSHETTVMYDENNKLFRQDVRLRLRRKINLKTNKEESEISYKKPKTREGVKIEEEFETCIGDFEEMEQILFNIGFLKISSYERIRDTFKRGGIKITTDSFPFGDYLEIEGNLKEIEEIAKELGFSLKKNITKSCDDIYAELCIKGGKKINNHILFQDKVSLEKEKQKRVLLLK